MERHRGVRKGIKLSVHSNPVEREHSSRENTTKGVKKRKGFLVDERWGFGRK